MKYIVVLGDGMADEPIAALGGMTPLAYAKTPAMDEMAGCGELGMVQNVPAGMKPGSDIANLSVLGYDPRVCYCGRSPLEALSIGVPMEDTDIVFRCNVVTLTEPEPYAQKYLLDHSAGEISSQDADILMETIRKNFNNQQFQYYSGTSYRHILVWKNGRMLELEPPHDHLGSQIGPWLPKEQTLKNMMEESFDLLNDHPINRKRQKEGIHKANALWFWGAGTRPCMQNFQEKTGHRGAMVSAVDLLKGMAVGTGMQVMSVPGATGSIDTNYEGKARAAVKALLETGCDFVYIHVEAPDEMGHQGLLKEKIRAIEDLDQRLIAPLRRAMEEAGEDYRMLVLPDHPTPLRLRTHTGDPVPYLLYDSTRQAKSLSRYNEEEARAAGNFEPEGHRLLARLLES